MCGVVEFLIPLGAETTGKRLFEEFIGWQTVLAAEYFGAFAYIPAVQVHCRESRVFGDSYRIQVARYGFHEVYASLAIGFLYGALAHAALAEAGECALGTVDQCGDQIAFLVNVGHTVFFECATARRGEVIENRRQYFFKFLFFFGSYRSSGIALYAAFAQTFVEVAQKFSFQEVETYRVSCI